MPIFLPVWITSELREDVSVPKAPAASISNTARPAIASCRAMASPTTPAPMTATSVSGSAPEVVLLYGRLEGPRQLTAAGLLLAVAAAAAAAAAASRRCVHAARTLRPWQRITAYDATCAMAGKGPNGVNTSANPAQTLWLLPESRRAEVKLENRSRSAMMREVHQERETPP